MKMQMQKNKYVIYGVPLAGAMVGVFIGSAGFYIVGGCVIGSSIVSAALIKYVDIKIKNKYSLNNISRQLDETDHGIQLPVARAVSVQIENNPILVATETSNVPSINTEREPGLLLFNYNSSISLPNAVIVNSVESRQRLTA